MIVELTVENLAIIERAQLRLEGGFTVLTGETGAGKSLLIDAIELALGNRADTELVRAGAPKATVSVVMDLSESPEAVTRCEELGIELEDGSLYLQRDVSAEGRSQARVAGRLTPVGTLRQVGTFLVDLHGQHDHQSLLDPERHIGYLDLWIGKPAKDALAEVAERYSAAEDVRKRLRSLRAGIRDREQKLDLLRFQVNEIESLAPKPGEMEELESQVSRLKHAEKLANAAFGALAGLSDEENCATDLLGDAVKSLEASVRYDASLETILEPLRSALVQLEEGTHALRAYSENLEADPAMLDQLTERIDSLKRLRRKYGEDEAAVLAYLENSRQELALLEDSEASEADLAEAVETADRALRESTACLTRLRKERAHEFARLVTEQLHDLAMNRAVFEVRFRDREPDAAGADEVEFIFTANAGEPPRPLSKIASGGEISRVMLAIKTALAGRAGVPTLVFDEVDAGLGGRAAATVARKLEELASHYQILVISHLPQIASRATRHFRIEKAESSGRVVTQVRPLDGEERVEEIARMLAGERLTESALANAREMLGW